MTMTRFQEHLKQQLTFIENSCNEVA